AHHRLLPAGNALASPWSIEMCMAMAYAGAEGKTGDAMRKALFFPAGDRLPVCFQSLRQSLVAAPSEDAAQRLRVANRIFHDQSLKPQPNWLNLTRTYYAAEAAPVDFHTDSGGASRLINQWVAEQTAGKIPEIIPDGALKPSVSVVLVNAVYFDQPWEERFTK